MPSFINRLADGWKHAQSQLSLALIPLVTALLDTDKITAVLAAGGTIFGFRLGLPTTVVDLWQFVSIPNEGVVVNVGLGGLSSFSLVFVALPIGIAIRAVLTAGYFGSIHETLTSGSYDFVANARRYFLPFVLYTLIPLVFFLPLVLFGLGGGSGALSPPLVVLLPVILVVSYLFYATPYLVVLRETGLVSAAQASYALALDGGSYLRFALGFAAFVFLCSLLATAIVMNFGLFGIALGVVSAAPVGLAANMATMRFVADIDPQSPSLDT